MPAQPSKRALVVEDLGRIPDDGYRYELQSGELVSEPMPGFRHGRIAATIASLVRDHVRRSSLGLVVVVEAGFLLSRAPDTVRGPDVALVARDRLEAIDDDRKAFPGAPDLAIEIVSPSNTPADVHAKVADYLAAGTRLVWVVDPETEQVTVYRQLLRPRRLSPGDTLDGEDVIPGLRVGIAEIFEG